MLPARRRPPLAAAFALALLAAPAGAVIMKLTPLKEVLDGEQFIFVAAVDKVEPDRPGVVFTLAEKLKGDTPFERLAVNLTGDAEAKKEDHTKVMLDRLAPGRKLVVFASKRGKRYSAFGFLEGTWFQMQGTPDDGGTAVRWAFLHCEPYLRRTFKGTTAELRQVVADGLAKKADPPGPVEKEPPGFGPPASEKGGRGKAEGGLEEPVRTAARSPSWSAGSGIDSPFPLPPSALLGVIPSFVLVGPLAVIAALFPGVFARLAVQMTRWRAFLVVASTNSTLSLVYFFVHERLPNVWAAGETAFTVYLTAVTAVGLAVAGRRYRRMAAAEPALTATPSRRELGVLAAMTAATGLLAASTRLFGPWSMAVEIPMREFTFIAVGLLAATLYAGYRAATRNADRRPDGSVPPTRLSLSGETVGLAALFLCGLAAVFQANAGVGGPRPAAVTTTAGDAVDAADGPTLLDVKVFEFPDAHQVLSSVALDGKRMYFGASKQTGFGQYGFVFAADADDGKVHWKFDADEELRPVFSTPAVAAGRVYFGEGLHTDSGCKLFCLDRDGKPAWGKPFETGSHTEGSPAVAGGKVVFSAGDDGLYCVDAATGAKAWHFPGQPQNLHVDTPPAVAGNRVFAGSGYGTNALLCVDAGSGKELWRTPVPLRSFGAPLVLGKRVVYGLGTGNLTLDVEGGEKEPAGAVVCVDADTGKEVWNYPLTRSVHTNPAADYYRVYAASRDGHVHCLDRRTGKLRWKTQLGTTLTAGPAVGDADTVYAVSTDGYFACLNAHTGQVVWARDLRDVTDRNVEVMSTPVVRTVGNRRSVYVGAMLTNRNNGAKTAAVVRFDDVVGE